MTGKQPSPQRRADALYAEYAELVVLPQPQSGDPEYWRKQLARAERAWWIWKGISLEADRIPQMPTCARFAIARVASEQEDRVRTCREHAESERYRAEGAVPADETGESR